MRLLLCVAVAAALAGPLAGQMTDEPEWREIPLPDGPGSGVPRLLGMATDGGTVWFSTEKDGIMGYDGATWVLHTEDDGGLRSDKYRHVMFVDANGDKWTAKDSDLEVNLTLDRLDDGGTFEDKSDDSWSYYSNPPELASRRVFSIAEDSNGNKWCGIRDENDVEPSVVELLIENGPGTDDDEWMAFGGSYDPDIFSANDVRGLAVDGTDRLWLIFERSGVDVWDFGDYSDFEDDTIVHYGVVDGLPSDAVHALLVGRDGRVWAGADNGVAVFDPDGESWTSVDGFPSDRVNDLAADAQGHIWAATDDGVVMLYASGEVARHYDTVDGLSDDTVTLIGVDGSDGTVWAVSVDEATSGTSLNVLESGFGTDNRLRVYPNPWRQGDSVDGAIAIVGAPEGSKVEIFDILGESVRKLPSRTEPFRWDSLSADLDEVPSGVYIIRVETPSGEQLFTKVAIIR